MIPVSLRCEYLANPLAIDTPHPRLGWMLKSDSRGARQVGYQILVASDVALLDKDQGDLWDSGRVATDQSTHVPYAGCQLASDQHVFWKVRVWGDGGVVSTWSAPASWRMGVLDPADWKARWIGLAGPLPEETPYPALPAPMLRTTFRLARPIKRAVATVSALGLYELRLNGARVGDHVLAPEWTDYNQRVQYQAYDVTSLLQVGDNAVGALLGDGWYAGRLGISHVIEGGSLRGHYGKRLRLLMRMVVEYADGTTEAIISDDDWRATAEGPIRKSCLLDGEVYDARREFPGWDMPGFDDSAWQPVDVVDTVAATLVAQPNEPIRVTEELEPAAITEPSPGVFVVDFGQNMAGICRLTVRGSAGTTIRLRHAERLKPDGNIYRDNLRMESVGGPFGARQEDQFTLRGDGTETFEPRFTYHGFRYVEVVGVKGSPSNNGDNSDWSIAARAVHSGLTPAGTFACSDELLNQLMRNIVWTHRNNMHGIPTDCPQRDERMGWSGDMLVFAQPACFNMDMAAFFTKWVRDLRDAQADDGRFPDIAPNPYDSNVLFSGSPAWADVGVEVPWITYLNYGDTRLLAEQFEAACRWVDWVHQNNPDLLWKNDRRSDYGDWLNGDTLELEGFPKGEAEMPKEVFATAFFQRSTMLVARMATLVGKAAAAEKYTRLAANIRQAFIDAYVQPDGRLTGHTQSVYALALDFDLVPDDLVAAAAEHMVERIKAYHDHISTGFLTTIKLMNALTRYGRDDVAYKLILNRTIPSWGYTIEQGATTIWERWDGYVAGRGFQNPGMNSFDHYAIGAVGEWMYRTILGINPDQSRPGYKHCIIRPRPGGGLTWARGSYCSIHGLIESSWRIEDGAFNLAVTIPANTTATVHVPAADPSAVTEGGGATDDAAGICLVGMEGGAAVYEAESGSYHFASTGVAIAPAAAQE